MFRRILPVVVSCLLTSTVVHVALAQSAGIDMKALAARTAPADGQKALQPLIGKWRATKSNYVLAPSPDKPLTSTGMTTERHWVGDARFIVDTTQGQLGGKPYSRMGMLGFNPMEKRYEWVTVDNQTPIMMSYHGPSGTVPGKPGGDTMPPPIDMAGDFSDVGVTGEANVGKSVPMRTHIVFESLDRHVIDLYFTPPGKPEMLADRTVYERVK